MSHICTRCKNVFDEGTDVLKGCPSCGCKKFEFVREGRPGRSEHHGDFDHEIGGEILISREMGVRKPPERSSRISLGHNSDRPVEDKTPQSEPPEDAQKFTTRKPAEKKDDKSQAKSIEGSVESIRISEPGTYELNLPSLFERDELIMAVKDGTYLIDLSTAFKKPKKE